MPPIAARKTFDDAKLATMTPPFTVRVEKRKGHSRTPITLPQGEEGQEPGTGFEVEDVRRLEEWLVTEWTGGGFYDFSVTDSTQPVPATMKWESWFDPKEYPERLPPPVVAAQAAAGIVPQAPTPIRSLMSGAFTHGFPTAASFGVYPQPQQPQQQQPQYPYAMPPPPPYQSSAYPGYAAEAERRRHEEEIKSLRDESARRDRDAQADKHKAELERVRAENQAQAQRYDVQMNDLRTMIAHLATTIKEGQSQARPNVELEAMQRKLDAETAAREAERRDRETREMIKQMQENAQKQIELLQRQIEEGARRASEASTQNQFNPIIKLMEDQARQNAEAIKEISRNSAAAIDKLHAMVLKPSEMMAFAKDANSGVEQTTERMARMFGSVIDLQQKAAENIMAMQPQGNSVVDLVREGVVSLKETAERYVGAKSASERVQIQAQVQLAQAQAQTQTAQAEAMKAAASVELANRQGPIVTPPPIPQIQIPAQASGLAGMKPGTVPANGKPPKKNGKAKVIPESKVKRLGKTDIEWFGPLISEVTQAREGVDLFLKNCENVAEAPDGEEPAEIEGMGPDKLADFVVIAAQMVMQAQLPIPALIDLLMQNRYADFIDVLIPNAPQTYRDDATQELIVKLKALTGEPHVEESQADGDDDEGGDEDADDDDGEDADDVKDGAVGKSAKPVAKPARASA